MGRSFLTCLDYLRIRHKKAVEQEKESIKSNFLEYGRLLINMYLPGKLVPENIYDMPFEDFLKLLAMAEIARDLRIEDIEVGVNKGYVEAHPDSQ